MGNWQHRGTQDEKRQSTTQCVEHHYAQIWALRQTTGG